MFFSPQFPIYKAICRGPTLKSCILRFFTQGAPTGHIWHLGSNDTSIPQCQHRRFFVCSFVYVYIQIVLNTYLVGGWTNPSWKIWIRMGIFPNFRDENKKYLKPPASSIITKPELNGLWRGFPDPGFHHLFGWPRLLFLPRMNCTIHPEPCKVIKISYFWYIDPVFPKFFK